MKWISILLLLLAGCNNISETKSATDSVQQESYAKKQIQNSYLIADKYRTEEIAQELVDRGYLKVYSRNFDVLKFPKYLDTVPRTEIQFERFRNVELKKYGLSELHEALAHKLEQERIASNIYRGKDNRYEVSDDEVNDYAGHAGQVMAILDRDSLKFVNNKFEIATNQDLKSSLSQYEIYPLCDSERFYEQPAQALGTAFPLDSVTIITAAHCLDDGKRPPNKILEQVLKQNLDRLRFVFGFYYDADHKLIRQVPAADYYTGIKVLKYRPLQLDCVIIRLDKPIKEPARIPSLASALPGKDGELFMIGYPNGIPEKITTHGSIITDNPSPSARTFLTDLDAFRGNSGSPVFDCTTGKVIGMLLNGGNDYVFSFTLIKCNKYRFCTQDRPCNGELALNIIYLKNNLNFKTLNNVK